jgi:hypothetical protein
MTNLFALFVFLQLADAASTAAVLTLGGVERNPLVLKLMELGPMAGLALAKGIALAAGFVCLAADRRPLLWCANAVFVAVVAWNVSQAMLMLL